MLQVVAGAERRTFTQLSFQPVIVLPMSSLHVSESLSGTTSDEILACAAALRALLPGAEPMAFWDFDGTLFEGDCSEGFHGSDGTHVPGLVETAVKAGFSQQYPARCGFSAFWQDYQNLMFQEGQVSAYIHLAKAFAGAPEAALQELAAQEFESRLRPWFFAEALKLWRELEAGGVRCVVISASPDFFVKGAAQALGVTPDRLYGLRSITDADGILTDRLQEPLSIGGGKATLVRQILAEGQGSGEGTRFPVAAFGNDFFNDGPMLEAVARTVLPGGQPVAVLVNAPPLPDGPGSLRRIAFQPRQFS
jgi:phosphoserine phosphatase